MTIDRPLLDPLRRRDLTHIIARIQQQQSLLMRKPSAKRLRNTLELPYRSYKRLPIADCFLLAYTLHLRKSFHISRLHTHQLKQHLV